MKKSQHWDKTGMPKAIVEALERLSFEQFKCVLMLTNPACRKSTAKIAKEIGISRSTVSKWKCRDTNGFNEAARLLSLYYASMFIGDAIKEWKALIEKGHWKAIEKAIDYALGYQIVESRGVLQ